MVCLVLLKPPPDCRWCCIRFIPQDLAVSSDADDPLPDPSCLHLTLNTAALRDVRTRSKPGADSTAVLGSVATTGGLWCCAAEWAGLSCRHSGTWQLSLVYDADELSKFSAVSNMPGSWPVYLHMLSAATASYLQHLLRLAISCFPYTTPTQVTYQSDTVLAHYVLAACT